MSSESDVSASGESDVSASGESDFSASGESYVIASLRVMLLPVVKAMLVPVVRVILVPVVRICSVLFQQFLTCRGARFPPSIFFIVGNEFCERFSYYGMRGTCVRIYVLTGPLPTPH